MPGSGILNWVKDAFFIRRVMVRFKISIEISNIIRKMEIFFEIINWSEKYILCNLFFL